ncbi:hypothetical protein PG994_014715 [Apiospora phragmitis]|uniref:Uncharacterized protein n=1 Tax=Apiospora phragmitis TaxID=2905665 RepID=A0ABR1SUD9_9PEZI
MALSRIEHTSPELKQLVLTYSTDWSSLRSAILSCPAFYSAFKGAEQWIATRFVKHLIDPDVLPEAFLAQGLRNLTTAWSGPESAKVIEGWLAAQLRKQRRVTDERLWVGDAIAMSRLHHAIDWFVDNHIGYCKIASCALIVPRPVFTLTERPLTKNERNWICKSEAAYSVRNAGS